MKKASKATKRKGPSKASLREMPEIDFSKAKAAGRGYFHQRAAEAGGYYDGPDGKRWVPLNPGRPKKGAEAEASSPKSIRLPDRLWAELDQAARSDGTTRHRLLRELIASWVRARHVKRSGRTSSAARLRTESIHTETRRATVRDRQSR